MENLSAVDIVIGLAFVVILAALSGGGIAVVLMNVLGYVQKPDVMTKLENSYESSPDATKSAFDLARDMMKLAERLATSVVPVDSRAYKLLDEAEDVMREISDGKPYQPDAPQDQTGTAQEPVG